MKNFIVCLLTVSLISCNNTVKNKSTSAKKVTPEKTCMDKVIKADDELGTLRNHACEKISLSKTISNYAKGLNQLNYNNCPKTFKSAFKKHTQAWVNMKKVTDNYPTLRGEMHDLFDQLEIGKDSLQFKFLLKDIWDTWGEIETAMK